MEPKPQVAIITRTKDRPVFLERAMRSVLAQTHDDWIHVIVNDGGDPKPVDLLAKVYSSDYGKRIRIVHHSKSLGMQNASNAGINSVDSTYVVIHDDDDSWYPDFLETTVGYLEEAGRGSTTRGVTVQTTQVFEEITVTGEIMQLEQRPYYPFDFVSLEEMRKRNLFAPIAFLYRRDAHRKVGLFRQEFDVLGDHDFNLRFLRHFEIGVIPTCHAYYHWRHGSMGNTVTRGRSLHRSMLSRLKNAYERELLDNPKQAVGGLEKIQFPQPDSTEYVPFNMRRDEPAGPWVFPDFASLFSYKVLSLDVFDTVLLRRCHHPRDVFRLLEERAARELDLPEYPYARARYHAEQIARKNAGEALAFEATFTGIYKQLAKLCGLTSKQAAALQKLELAIEREVLYGDPRWIKLYESCQAAGKRIIFISDMYLDSKTITALLEKCGFPDAEVYVSCELKASKHEGSLQPLIAGKLGIEAKDILHVGDNFNSDYLKTIHAGWQAFHWDRGFLYTPWWSQVNPFVHIPDDCLSTRLIGEVARLGLIEENENADLILKLGRELAGPMYLCYMRWVLEQARKDGIRKLILIGRDGYYWEKTLRLLNAASPPEIEFVYLHASRKVHNFASFRQLDERALKFLMTPNPALSVLDFVDRTGLKSENYSHYIKMAGFDHPEQVLTPEGGGHFLDDSIAPRLRHLFQLLEPELKPLFASDRAGVVKMLNEARYDPENCAFVDIGWNGSCVRPIGRILELPSNLPVKAYFFGTWKEAGEGEQAIDFKSYFIEFDEPREHFSLVRESVNLLEALHAAPFPPLLAFTKKEDSVEPVFGSELKGGFSETQQGFLWKGAESFIKSILASPLPASGKHGGHGYLNLVLSRFLREPSPEEIKTWGSLLHSDGFGIEVYKPLILPISQGLSGDEVLSAYHGSSWKRGFLSSLSEDLRQFVLDRIDKPRVRTYDELLGDLRWKIKQADDLWSEKERYKWEKENAQSEIVRLSGAVSSLEKDLFKKTQQIEIQEQHHKEMESKREHLKEQIGRLKEQLDHMAEKMKGEEAKSRDLATELKNTVEQVNGLNRQLQDERKKSTGLLADLEYTQKLLHSCQAELGESGKMADQLKQSVEEAGVREQQLKKTLEERIAQLGELQGQIQSTSEALKLCQAKLEKSKKQETELQQALDEALQREASTSANLDEVKTILATLTETLSRRSELAKALIKGRLPLD